MSIASNYPAIKPTLLLDFANTEQLDPRVTYSRASTATYYGTQTAKAEQNLQVYSQQFDESVWKKDATTVAANTGATTAPDGTSTADKIVETATTAIHQFYRLPTPVVGLNYTFSIFLKAAERGFAFLRTDNTAFDAVTVDLSTGAASGVNGSPTNIISTNAGNGWWRVSFTSTASATSNWYGAAVSTDGVWANRSYAGDGTSGIYAWGAQVEQRSAVTAYTPTTTQPITNYIPVLETAASGVARFDHNPTTFESLGLLVEEQRTNLILRSEEFQTTWTTDTGNPIVSVNTIVAPDGTLTADKLIEGTTDGGQNILQTNVSFPSVGQYAYSVYAKKAERFKVALRESTSTGAAVLFDLNIGTVLSTTGGGSPSPSGLIQDVGNGWYRCTMILAQASAANRTVRIYVVPDAVTTATGAFAIYTGDGYSGIYIWGAQLEAGAFPTSYIPTVASQVTRSADAASMTGANFSSWYRADRGTIYAETVPAISGYSPVIQIDNGTADNRILVEGGVDAHGFVRTNAVTVCSIDMGATSANTNAKFALAYKVNDFAGSLNAGTVGTDTDGILPVVTTARIGANTVQSYTQTIKKIAFYPERISNAELQGVTS